MFIDSHCHLNFPGLAENLDAIFANMRANDVSHALCVSVDLAIFPQVLELAERHDNLYASVGVHPDYELETEPTQAELVRLAQHPKVIAIGETGLDYFRLTGDLDWQRERFRTHIRAARECGKPLIIHTRSAAAGHFAHHGRGGCRKDRRRDALFHRKSGSRQGCDRAWVPYLVFRNPDFQECDHHQGGRAEHSARKNPDRNRLAIPCADSARGKTNQPAFVKHVAEEIARLRNITLEEVGTATSQNFRRLFLKHS